MEAPPLTPHLFAIAENLLLIVGLPWLFSDMARDWVARIDNRGMFSIPFCRSLAVACGGVLAIATAVLAGLQNEISLSSLWSIFGFWQEGRFLVILERYADALCLSSSEAIGQRQFIFVQILFLSAILLGVVNLGIAVMGWRSLGALRGLLAHGVISISVWLTLTVRGLAALWVLHWLNFWALLILLIVLELRRREEKTTRLSF
jgi:hypothetical protein